jgi:hypothetical protein
MVKFQGAVKAPGQRAGGGVVSVNYNECCDELIFMMTMII